MELAKEYLMHIDGRWTKSSTGETFEVRNPYDGSHFATIQKGSREDARSAIDAAYRAKESWAKTLAVERADYLYRLYDLMKDKRDEFVDTLIKERLDLQEGLC